MTLLNDVGPHNIIVGCSERNFNLSLHTHLLEHSTIIYQEPTKQEMNFEYCYRSSPYVFIGFLRLICSIPYEWCKG
jgi:hypothetical protein